MFIHWDAVKGFFPHFFIQEEDGAIVHENDPVNEEDANIHPNLSGKFNIESGLWEYPALSQQKPREMMDPDLVNFTLERNEMIASKKLNASTGLYSSYICKPSPVQEDGSAKTCNCGNVYITRHSFTSFCNEMTRKYQTTNIMAGPFMSTNTFISWFFCWIAAFKINFHQERDPWCENKPPILACDGTHISVSIRNLNLRMSVMEPDLPHVTLKAQHKRNDQLLIRDASSRKHLKYLCRKYLKKKKEKELIDEELELTRTQETLSKVFSENKFGSMEMKYSHHNRNCMKPFWFSLEIYQCIKK